MNKEIQKILDDLNSWGADGITKYESNLSEEHVSKIIELAEYYSKTDAESRESIRNSVKEESYVLLQSFFLRIAGNASRTGNKRLLFLALIVLSIEDFREDYRMGILNLGAMAEEIGKMGENRKELFEKVALLSSTSFAEWLRSKPWG